MRRGSWIVLAMLSLALWAWLQRAPAPDDTGPSRAPDVIRELPHDDGTAVDAGRTALPAFLPHEAHDTLRLIARGGPFPHRQDGGTFHNRERRLPSRQQGWYREYTVSTPGARDRGARRIVSGGDPPAEFWYSDDHYRSFRRFAYPPETTP